MITLNDHLNKDFTINVIKEPFDAWIIDNFLTEESLDVIHQNWPSNDHPSWNATRSTINGKKNILEQGMLSISNPYDIPSPIENIIMLFHSNRFASHISDITNVRNLVVEKTMNWSGLRVMLPNSKQLIHSDARINPVTGLRKEITCLLYLNKEYKKESHGGCLELWNDSMQNCVREIEPIDNRLVLFRNNDKSYHGVPAVKKRKKSDNVEYIVQITIILEKEKGAFRKAPHR